MTDFVTNDTGSKIEFTCQEDATGTAINLTGATVVFRWEDETGTIVTKSAAITNAAAGIVEYQLLAGEIVYPHFSVEVEITDALGGIISNLDLERFTSREELG